MIKLLSLKMYPFRLYVTIPGKSDSKGCCFQQATDEDEDRLKENIKYKKKMDCTVAVVSDLEKGTDNGLVNDGYVPPSYEINAVTTKL